MSTRRRWKRWLVAGLTLGVLFVTLVLWLAQDDRLVSHADLQPPEMLPVTDADNAWWHLGQVDALVVKPPTLTIDDLEAWVRGAKPLTAPARTPDWNDVETCLEGNAAALAQLERAIARDHYRAPPVLSYTDPLSLSLLSTRRNQSLLQLRVGWHMHHGRARAALDDVLRQVRYGAHLLRGPRMLIDWMIGLRVMNKALGELERVAVVDGVGAETLRGVLAEGLGPDGPPSNLAAAFRGEYQSFRGTLLRASDEDIAQEWRKIAPYLPAALTYRRNRTINRAADYYRGAIAHLEQGRSDRYRPSKTAPTGKFQTVLTGNIVGENILELCLPYLPADDESQLRFRWNRLRVTLAERIYELEHGRLPPGPEALVPDILPELP